jgi:copper(I)-binding protein
MRSLDELRVGAGESVALAPGGLHLMLMRPKRTLRAGDAAEVEFVLKDGSRQRVSFEVKADAPR